MRKIINISIMTVILFAAAWLRAEKDNSSAAFTDFKLPQYDEKGKLMFILYGKSGHAVGINVELENVLVDLIRSSVRDIDTVKDFSGLTLYPINTPTVDVVKFWADKLHCEALIWSPSAVFDRSTNIIRGNDKVMFRSPALDIDGVGFDAESASKSIHLRKNVKVVIRTELVPRAKAAGKTEPSTGKNTIVNEKKP